MRRRKWQVAGNYLGPTGLLSGRGSLRISRNLSHRAFPARRLTACPVYCQRSAFKAAATVEFTQDAPDGSDGQVLGRSLRQIPGAFVQNRFILHRSVSTEVANDVPTSLGDVVALMSLHARFLAMHASARIWLIGQSWWQVFWCRTSLRMNRPERRNSSPQITAQNHRSAATFLTKVQRTPRLPSTMWTAPVFVGHLRLWLEKCVSS